MSRWEEKDHAAEWLAEHTRKPGSGVTARTPRPARESLYSFDLENAGIPTSIDTGVWDDHDKDDEADTALARLMDGLLNRLSPRQKQAVELVAVAGLTFGAAAKEMGTSKATLYAHYRDGIARLRAALESEPWAAAIVGPWLTGGAGIGADDDGPEDDPAGAGIVRRLPSLADRDDDAPGDDLPIAA
jgi:hypothetical protein